jgi:DNA-binding HxlR family transcriptional regulator
VENSLTAKGIGLEVILLQMCEVGTRYLDHEDSCQKAVQLV